MKKILKEDQFFGDMCVEFWLPLTISVDTILAGFVDQRDTAIAI
jgi:hypothetical protein